MSLHALQTRLKARALPPSWIIAQTAMDSLMLIVPSASMSVRCPACVRHRASLLVQHQCLQNSSENVQPSNSVLEMNWEEGVCHSAVSQSISSHHALHHIQHRSSGTYQVSNVWLYSYICLTLLSNVFVVRQLENLVS